MLFADSVSKAYAGDVILRDVSFTVGEGEHVAIVGPNGCGKSTLLRLLSGIETPDDGSAGHRNGAVGFLQQDAELTSNRILSEEMWVAFPEAQAIELRLAEIAALIDQAPDDLDALIEEQAKLFDDFDAMDGYRIDKRISRVLRGLGFSIADRDKQCGAFSGGWKMRIALAQVLVRRPEHMLLDEPTNHLDAAARDWLIEHLRLYKGTAVIVAHDGAFLDHVVHRVIELRDGVSTSYTGGYTSYQRQKAEQIAQTEAAAANQRREIARQERFIERFRYKQSKARSIQSRVKALAKVDRIKTERAQKEVSFPYRTGRPNCAGSQPRLRR